jgi:hypothetical protein
MKISKRREKKSFEQNQHFFASKIESARRVNKSIDFVYDI